MDGNNPLEFLGGAPALLLMLRVLLLGLIVAYFLRVRRKKSSCPKDKDESKK